MQSEQQPAPDYSFLNEPSKPAKFSLRNLFRGGGSKQSRLMVAAVGGIVLVVLLWGFALVFGGNGNGSDRLVDLVAQQNELIRVAKIGEKDATTAETKNFATTVDLSMVTAEYQLNEYVAEQGRKIKSAEESSAKNESTDAALTTAAQVNNFDQTFNQTMKAGLDKYLQDLSNAYDASDSNSQKQLLQDLYKNAKVLTQAIPAV